MIEKSSQRTKNDKRKIKANLHEKCSRTSPAKHSQLVNKKHEDETQDESHSDDGVRRHSLAMPMVVYYWLS
jgi:hypothetical protein